MALPLSAVKLKVAFLNNQIKQLKINEAIQYK